MIFLCFLLLEHFLQLSLVDFMFEAIKKIKCTRKLMPRQAMKAYANWFL